MKSLILVSALLVGFSASAQVCKVSQDIVERIEEAKSSNMMAKPKYTTIKALVATDECVAQYLNDGDAATLAREVMALNLVSSEQILNSFVQHEEEKLQLEAAKTCSASRQTLESINQLKSSGMHVKALYVSVKGLLADDECLSLELGRSQIVDLAKILVYGHFDKESTESIIDGFLAQ